MFLFNSFILFICIAASALAQKPAVSQVAAEKELALCAIGKPCWYRCTDRRGEPYCERIRGFPSSIRSTYPGIPNHGRAYRSRLECLKYCKKSIPAKNITGYVTADNVLMSTCADGVQLTDTSIPDFNDWTKAKKVTMPHSTRIFGIHAQDQGVAAGIMAKLSNGVMTNKYWKCTSKHPGRGFKWCTEKYNDSYWANANPTFSRTVYPWGNQPGLIPLGSAEWIWDGYYNPGQFNGQAKPKESWCRIRFCNGRLCRG